MINKNYGKLTEFLFVAITVSSCASHSGRKPSSEIDLNLSQIITSIKNTSDLMIQNPSQCTAQYDQA